MKKTLVSAAVMLSLSGFVWAGQPLSVFAPENMPKPEEKNINNINQVAFNREKVGVMTQTIPPVPNLDAKAYIVLDEKSGKVVGESNADTRLPPASLTKLMTVYITFEALAAGRIHLNDEVPISEKAWRTGGSKMFVRVGTKESVENLIKGVTVVSGNDACIALAEYIAGTEDAFTDLMNQQAKLLGMKNTHYTDSNGLPHPDHYTSARDLSLLARAIVHDFPENYKKYFSIKEYTYSNIKQPNRNNLLWKFNWVDGMKTGHTSAAGYCLVASGLQNGMRLISVVLGAPSGKMREQDSVALLNYGFRYYQSFKVFSAMKPILTERVWMSPDKTVNLGVTEDAYLTIPAGQAVNLEANLDLPKEIHAPLKKGQSVGTITVSFKDKVIGTIPLLALSDAEKGGLWTRMTDGISLSFHNIFANRKPEQPIRLQNG